MYRRDFMKFAGALAAAGLLPPGLLAFAASSPSLPIPPLLKPDADGYIRLRVGQGQSRWRAAPTTTWGFNGPLLGPTLLLRQGQPVRIEVSNSLPEDTTVHWHGLEIPGTADGGPQALIAPGASLTAEFVTAQPAATCWYHPHPHMKTGRQTALGLAGLILIEDEAGLRLPLPRKPGVDDVPLILQDKRLNAADQIDYAVDSMSAAVGWFGDIMLANGVVYPQHVAPRGFLRLRLLNGCNARTLQLAVSDGRGMHIIAGDGGFLPEPVYAAELTLLVGERCEVLIEVRDKPFDLVSLPVRQMGMGLPPFDMPLPVLRIQPSREEGSLTLPRELVSLPPLPRLEGMPMRRLQLSMDPRLDREGMMELMRRYGSRAMQGMDMHGNMGGMGGGMQHGGGMGHGDGMRGQMRGDMGHGGAPASGTYDLWRANRINGRAFSLGRHAFNVKKGQYERWVISGEGDMMLHPFHIHGTRFRILSENGAPPSAHRSAFKDIVRVEGRVSEVLVRFDHSAPAERAYMAHCHILEHEDTGMMLSFTVS